MTTPPGEANARHPDPLPKGEGEPRPDPLPQGEGVGDAHLDPTFAAYCARLRERYPVNGRVLFVQIPQLLLESFNRDVALHRGYYAFPPTGLQVLHQALQGRGLEVRILDLNFETLRRVHEDAHFRPEAWTELLRERVRAFDPFLVGVSCMYDAGITALLETMRILRAHGRCVVVAGGVIATYEHERFLTDGLAHFVVRGEGEDRLRYLADTLTERTPPAPPAPGIHYRAQGMERETRGRARPVQPRGDLIATYGGVPVETYCRYGSLNPFSRMAGGARAPYAAVQLSRGCRGACTFCSVRDFMGRGVRLRPVEDLLAELRFLVRERGVRHFEWLDDDPLFHREAFHRVLATIVDEAWPVTWAANNGLMAASLDEETLTLIRDSGCIGFKIGVETGNPDMLRRVRKPGSLDLFRGVARRLDGFPELFVGANFILGLPDETFAMMLDTLRFSLELGLDWNAFTLCQAIRGATAFDDFADYFAEQMASGGANVHNFIPSRESRSGEIAAGRAARGPAVFGLPGDLVPDEAQTREVWFAFNLVANFFHNKHLAPGGRPEQFVRWVDMARVAYPTNPYMSLFLCLARRLTGDDEQADQDLARARTDADTPYWRERFAAFGLDEVLADPPREAPDVHAAVDRLRERAAAWMTQAPVR